MEVQDIIKPFFSRKGLTEEEKTLRSKQARNRATVAYRNKHINTYRAYQRSVYHRRKEEDPEFSKKINEKNKRKRSSRRRRRRIFPFVKKNKNS